MPRYKPIHKGLKLLPVDFDKQVQTNKDEQKDTHFVYIRLCSQIVLVAHLVSLFRCKLEAWCK